MITIYKILGLLGFGYCPICGTKMDYKIHGYYDEKKYYCPYNCKYEKEME